MFKCVKTTITTKKNYSSAGTSKKKPLSLHNFNQKALMVFFKEWVLKKLKKKIFRSIVITLSSSSWFWRQKQDNVSYYFLFFFSWVVTVRSSHQGIKKGDDDQSK